MEAVLKLKQSKALLSVNGHYCMYNFLSGDTVEIAFVMSGQTASQAGAIVYDKNNVSVDSMALTSSGNGHYYGFHTIPSSVGFYVAQTTVWVNSEPYINRVPYKAYAGDV